MAHNPFDRSSGPDFHIRTYLADLFEQFESENRKWEEQLNWAEWSNAEIAGAVRALSRDYLATHGRGFDWLSAATEAEFVLAATYNEVLFDAVRQHGVPNDLACRINFYDPTMQEGLMIDIQRPGDQGLTPMPGYLSNSNNNSSRSRAELQIPPMGDAFECLDDALVFGVKELGTFFQNTSNLPLIMMGAALTVWKGLQSSHQCVSGAIFRGIVNSTRHDMPANNMQIISKRSSPSIDAEAASDNQGLFLKLV